MQSINEKNTSHHHINFISCKFQSTEPSGDYILRIMSSFYDTFKLQINEINQRINEMVFEESIYKYGLIWKFVAENTYSNQHIEMDLNRLSKGNLFVTS